MCCMPNVRKFLRKGVRGVEAVRKQSSRVKEAAAPRRIEKQQQHFVVAVQKIVKTIAS